MHMPLKGKRVLRETAYLITPSLTYLFNLSLKTCTFPDEWKSAVVCPIFKNRGSRNNPSNYRPVSLLSAVGKTMDALQSHSLTRYLVSQKIVSDHQFGFLPGRSTTTQLVYLFDQWSRTLEQQNSMAVVFMDFMKAFDKVWHQGLIYKLAQMGVGRSALDWLRNYLSNRSISVRVGSSSSAKHSVTAGVPQGSHLGPILFLCFINDLPDKTGHGTDIYADDTIIQHTLHAPDINDDLLSLQTSITAAETWASSWHGRFGHSKTALLPIGQLAETSVRASTPEVEGQPIILVKQHKHLGVVFSNQLDWSAHMMHLLSMGKRKAGFLRFMARELPADLICRLYVSCVRPVLEYASPVWHGGITRQQAIALERIQASVARRVLKAPWRTPKQVLLERLQWPSLFWRRCVATTCLLHTLMHNPTSPLNQCLFPFAQSLSSYNLRKPRQLILPRLRTSRHLHSFFYNSARLWNSLPHSLQSIPNHAQFRKALSHHWKEHQYKPLFNL